MREAASLDASCVINVERGRSPEACSRHLLRQPYMNKEKHQRRISAIGKIMGYSWLGALHIASVIIWIGGTFLSSLVISFFFATAQPRTLKDAWMIRTVLRWDSFVTSPAMLIAWAVGLTMAVQGDWITAPWFLIKLVIVIALSALHGIEAGTLRRMVNSPDPVPPAVLRRVPGFLVFIILVVSILSVVKPYG